MLFFSATNPSSFDIQFYVNDLNRPQVSTFTEIGSFNYQENGNTQLVVSIRKVTDGLLIRGRYRTLTIAVFGTIADNATELDTNEKNEEECIKERECIKEEEEDDNENILGDKRQEVIDAIMQRLEVRVSGSSGDLRKNVTPFSPEIMAKSLKSPSMSDVDSPVPEKVLRRSPLDSIQATPSLDDFSASSNFSDVKTPRSPLGTTDDTSCEPAPSILPPIPDDLENISPENSILEDEIDAGMDDGQMDVDDGQMDVDDGVDGGGMVQDEAEAISSEDDFDDDLIGDELEPEQSSKEQTSKEQTPSALIPTIHTPQVVPEATSTNNSNPVELDDEEDLDPISSDEEDMDPIEIDYNDKSDYMKFFDVNSFDLQPLVFFSRSKMLPNEEKIDEKRKLLELCSKVSNFKEDIALREKWVEVLETVTVSFSSKSLDSESGSILVDWLSSALDFELALQQQQVAMKVRQLKAGIKLFIFLSSSSRQVFDNVISSESIRLLLDLYNKEYMTLPLKLLILKAIDSLADTVIGMECILKQTIETRGNDGQGNDGRGNDGQGNDGRGNEKQTVYQWIVQESMVTNSTRILAVIAAFLKKCNLYECIVDVGNMIVSKCGSELDSEEGTLLDRLQCLRSSLRISNTFMRVPTRILPTGKIFEVNISDNGFQSILDWFHDLNFLSTCHEILKKVSSQAPTQTSRQYDEVRKEVVSLIMDIVRGPKGVHFLLQDEKSVSHTLSILSSLSKTDPQLHYQTAYYLHVTHLLDQVVSNLFKNGSNLSKNGSNLSKNGSRVDASDPDSVLSLHLLFMSLFSFQGRICINHLLSDDDHLSQVIKIVQATANCNGDEGIVFEYFSRILLDYVKYQDENALELIQSHGNDLLELSRLKIFSPFSAFISNFMTIIPFSYNPSSFQVLSNILKRGIEQDFKTSLISLPSIPPQVLTCLRILNQVCISSEMEIIPNEDIPREIKYDYGLVQMFSSECFIHIIQLLDRITNNHLSIPHVSLFTDSNYYTTLSTLKLSTNLISALMHTIIKMRGSNFQDVSIIQPFLKVYCLLSHVPQDHDSRDEVHFLMDTIVHTLSMFCRLPEDDSMSEDELLKSVWTKTIREIFSFISSSSVAMKSGLRIFSQLLPDTLSVNGSDPVLVRDSDPVLVRDSDPVLVHGSDPVLVHGSDPVLVHGSDPVLVHGSDLNGGDLRMLMNLRKLWIVHLRPFKEEIESLGSCLCCCSEEGLRNDVLQVLTKISDLSPETSTAVVQSFMSSLNAVRFKRPQLRSYLWLLDHLLQDCSFRVTFIYLIRDESTKKEGNFLHDLLLLSNPHDAEILMVS